MKKRIFYDGLNLALDRGTGIATYTRVLAKVAGELGNEVGVLANSRDNSAKNRAQREIGFLDKGRTRRKRRIVGPLNKIADYVRCLLPTEIVEADPNGPGVSRQFGDGLPPLDQLFLARDIFKRARYRFYVTGRFTTLNFSVRPDIMHCTYQLPVRAKSACNVVTIHDLVPLRLPFATLDNKRITYRLLKKVAAEADHIVTISEHSRRDIVELLGVDEKRITNTYQAVELPPEYVARNDDLVSDQLAGAFGLDFRGYLLFFGAIEPKKNVGRLLEAYFASGVRFPLVIVSSGGWANEAETRALAQHREMQEGDPTQAKASGRVIHFEYVESSLLATLIKGARAVVFPSLYEGFGLPVLEAMTLGTPAITSREASLPEIAGDAALLVDPYNVDEIARAIVKVAEDSDLCAELAFRGKARAELFSLSRYRERIERLYDAIG